MIIAVLVPESHRVRLPHEPKMLWTAIPPDSEPDDVPDSLIHHQNAFHESPVHDWSWKNGELRYFSRCVENDEQAWIYVDVPDRFEVNQFWKTRDGQIRRIVEFNPKGVMKTRVKSVCRNGQTMCHYQNGRKSLVNKKSCDLIKLMPSFVAEAGTFLLANDSEPPAERQEEFLPNSVMKPQRFRWISKGYSRTKDGCCVWNATNQFWEIHTFGLHKIAYFEESPVDEMRKLIGQVSMFEWLDNDFEWEALKAV